MGADITPEHDITDKGSNSKWNRETTYALRAVRAVTRLRAETSTTETLTVAQGVSVPPRHSRMGRV